MKLSGQRSKSADFTRGLSSEKKIKKVSFADEVYSTAALAKTTHAHSVDEIKPVAEPIVKQKPACESVLQTISIQ